MYSLDAGRPFVYIPLLCGRFEEFSIYPFLSFRVFVWFDVVASLNLYNLYDFDLYQTVQRTSERLDGNPVASMSRRQ